MAGVGRFQKRDVVLADSERAELALIVQSRSASRDLVCRAQIILASASGESNASIARRLGLGKTTIWYWRKMWCEQGVAGLYGEALSGRPRTHDEEVAANLLSTVLKTKPPTGKRWTVRSVAEATGLPKSSVARMLAWFGFSLHRTKLPNPAAGPLFVDKVKYIAGLYLNPPEHAFALGVDESSRIKANGCPNRVAALGLGDLKGIAHGHVRSGPTTLFAALDIANGKASRPREARQRHQDFLDFLEHIDGSVPAVLDVHLVVDHNAAERRPEIRAWLANRPRFHIHLTASRASWLDQMRRSLALLSQRRVGRACYVSARDLAAKIAAFRESYGAERGPFVWTAVADMILVREETRRRRSAALAAA